jgi:hypothetical protein
MILLLSDETWERVSATLEAHEPKLLWDLTAVPALPEDRELVRMSRNGATPEAFTRAAALRQAGVEAAASTRERLAELVREAHAAGVGAAVLSRWAELKPTRIYEILEGTG